MTSLKNNIIPDNVKKIHLIAVCGTGMGALACMLKDLGLEVTGSDQKVYPPMSDFLFSKGIKAADGFNANNLLYGPDLVVVGNAVSKDNVEVKQMQKMGLNFCSMPQALNRFVADGKKTILATGTHGKTTTSSLIAWILYEAGLDPSFMIGGILNNFNSNYRVGKGRYVVIEGDEYDTAFFDKGPKFMHYDPFRTVLTSVEFDHADIFRDIAHIRQTFDNFIDRIYHKNILFTFDDDQNISDLIKGKRCCIESYGKNKDSSWSLGKYFTDPPWSVFEVLKKGEAFGTFKAKLMGEHNLLNALSSIAVADSLEIPINAVKSALETFENVKRRQEIRGTVRGITVMDDFAHHPTAVRETIKGVKRFYNKGRLIAVFEPRTNSSMRSVFQDIYPLSFDNADLICIRKPPLLEKIPTGERFSSEKLVDDLKIKGKDAYYFSDTQTIIDFLLKTAKTDDVILIMSNGGFDNIHSKLLELL